MSKLLSAYALSTGLTIDEIEFMEDFYPLPFEKYITLQTGSGQPGKNYDYYQEVIGLIKPVLDKYGIEIVHLGASTDPKVVGPYDLLGKTSVHQSHYLLKKAMAHFGGDSWIQHVTGHDYVPTLVLFGTTHPAQHGSYWENDKTVYLESHRSGNLPSYGNEQAKTINFIKPEDVAREILLLVGIDYTFGFESYGIGPTFTSLIFEVIPNQAIEANFSPNSPFVVRMDYHFDEVILQSLLQTGRKINLITNRPINLQLLTAFKSQIIGYIHELSPNIDCPITYVREIKKLITKHVFHSHDLSPSDLAAIRFKYFDICNVEETHDLKKEEVQKTMATYLNKEVDIETIIPHLHFKTNKFLISGGKIYLSFPHVLASENVQGFENNTGKVIDSPQFWKDSEHFYYQKYE